MTGLISTGEVRLALRLIVKQPILSVTIILALATGICLATMGFTIREELVYRTLPYAAGDRFTQLFAVDRHGDRQPLGLERYRVLRDHAVSFEHVGAGQTQPFAVTHGPDDVETIRGMMLTPRSMQWLEAAPLHGRIFIPADGDSGAEAVVLIRESLWHRRYGGDEAMVGRQIVVNGRPRTVVGIMPDSFKFSNAGEMWVPLDELTLGGRADALFVFGVLRPGMSVVAADDEAKRLSAQVPPATPDAEGARAVVRSFTVDPNDSSVAMSAMVFVLVMVLMVVASNVATLIFARTWSRAPELAVRSALGADRVRVVGQLFLETLVLGSIAAMIGLSASWGILRAIRGTLGDIPFWITLTPTPRTALFVVALTLLVGVVSGLVPALRVTRHDLRNSLQAGRGFAAGGFGRIGAVLLVVEIALSVGLLNGAVTMARAFESYVDDVPALPRNQVLTTQLGRVQDPLVRDKVVEAVAAIPGVIAAGAAEQLPRLYPQPRPTVLEPVDGETPRAAMTAPSHAVGEGFMEAIGARALSGRLFTRADFRAGAAPVAIVNEPFVQKFFGGRNPLGRRIRIERPREAEEPWREVVGVVPDLGLSVANPSMAAGFYMPVRDETLWHLAIRTAGDPLKLTPRVRAAAAAVDPDAVLEEVKLLDEAGYEERWFLSSTAIALTAMGGMALVLSIVGIYALLSFMVTRRTREIGIRIALGATRAQVVRSIAGGAMILLMIGGLIGSGLGLAMLRMRDLLLVSIPNAGVWMPATIFLTLALAGGIAAWMPTRRALGIRPSEALSAD